MARTTSRNESYVHGQSVQNQCCFDDAKRGGLEASVVDIVAGSDPKMTMDLGDKQHVSANVVSANVEQVPIVHAELKLSSQEAAASVAELLADFRAAHGYEWHSCA